MTIKIIKIVYLSIIAITITSLIYGIATGGANTNLLN